MTTWVLALAGGVLLTGCTAFMGGFCSRDNKAGGYCESYNQQRTQQPPVIYVAPVPSSPLRDAVDYATGRQPGCTNPSGYGGGCSSPTTHCQPDLAGGFICRSY